jgi:CheY-like chemotaxis protein
MDHMMPGMDGIKTTSILRSSGYNQPIVALTANAISGQSEMFLSNGFDKFVSKPIDSRELDLVLTELIRNKKPPEIIEAARREKEKAVITPKKDLTELEKYFVRDAEAAVKVLENIYAKIDGLADTDIELYTTTVHGIKSALANIGETKLSEFAFELENAGETPDFSIIADKIPVFIEKLKSLIEKLKPQETGGAAPASYDDMLCLKEKLSEFSTACETFNIRTVKAVLNDLKQKTWPQEITNDINEISVSVVHGDFKKAVSVAERILNTPDN